MSGLRDRLERLAARGAPGRGADDVLAAAARAAAASTTTTTTNEVGTMTDDLEPIELEVVDAPRRLQPRRRPMRALAAAGVAALVGVGALAVSALGGGGSDSPEGAVRQLARAIDAEDPLAAADVLAPSEVRTLRATVDRASRRAAELELVETASAPFAGIDLAVEELELETEDLADGYARVYLRRGSIRAATNAANYSALVQRSIDDPTSTSDAVALADLSPADLDPFVVAIRDDGRWYVSAAYTVLEYVREANGGGPADYGSGIARATELGAESPEGAARAMADAIAAEDWTTVFSLLPPDEIPLYDYREVFTELLADTDADFTVDAWNATAEIDGDDAVVSVAARGSFGDGEQWELADQCLRTTYTYEGWVDPEFPEFSEPPTTGEQAFCLSDRSSLLPLGLFLWGGPDEGDGSGVVRARAVRNDGRWFLSPVGTVLERLDAWVESFDERALYTLLDLPAEIEPEGELTIGAPVAGQADGGYLSYTYRFRGTAGQRILAETSVGQDSRNSYVSVRLLDADGEEIAWSFDSFPVDVPADGEYLVVVDTYVAGPYTLTLWDEASAPEELRPYFTDEGFPLHGDPGEPTLPGYIDENGAYCYRPTPNEEVCSLTSDGDLTTETSLAPSGG